MQLDQTHIVIRSRTLAEIGDLALLLIRGYPAASILGMLVGLAPWAIANACLLAWIPLGQLAGPAWQGEYQPGELARYVFLMTTLVILQTPIAGALTTVLIGRAVFEREVKWRSAVAELWQRVGACFWVLAVFRGPVPLLLILASNWGQAMAGGRELLVPIVLLIAVGFQRARRPFLPEILLLERCPLRARSPEAITVAHRSAALHGPMAGELIGRFLMILMMLGVLFAAIFYALLWGRGVFLERWDWTLGVYLLLFPAALWIVAGLSVLIRFLNYLDTRIRLEGWEVDLAVRAEAQRQFGNTAVGTGAATATHRSGGQSGGRGERLPAGPARSSPPGAAALDRSTGRGTGAGLMAVGLCLLVPTSLAAAPPATSSVNPQVTLPPSHSTPWYDAEAQSLRPVRVRTRLPDVDHVNSDWLAKPQKAAPRSTGTTTVGSGNPLVGWGLVVLLAGLLIALLAFVFRRMEPGARADGGGATGRDVDAETLQRMRLLPPELRRSGLNLRDEAERLMLLQQWDAAVVMLFGHQLLLLDRCGWLRLARGKTNGRYLSETRRHNPAGHELLAGTVAAFEASYFGGHALDGADLDQLWTANTALESLVQGNAEGAP